MSIVHNIRLFTKATEVGTQLIHKYLKVADNQKVFNFGSNFQKTAYSLQVDSAQGSDLAPFLADLNQKIKFTISRD